MLGEPALSLGCFWPLGWNRAAVKIAWDIRNWPNDQKKIGKRALKVINMSHTPANIYLFKVKNRSTGKSSEICSKLTYC